MKTLTKTEFYPRMVLHAKSAADLMTPNPVSVRSAATVREAINLLIDKGISAAPVIDMAGQPLGVISRADILVHDREKADYLPPSPEYYHQSDLTLDTGEKLNWGFQIEKVDTVTVGDLMTPVVFSVPPNAPVNRVVEDMLSLKVHRLFVVDADGILIGVISGLDILKHLRPEVPVAGAADVQKGCAEKMGYDLW